MAAFDFPASPTLNQEYSLNGVTYRYNGYAWDLKASGGTGGAPTTTTLTAGAGLSGGGDLSANRTFDVGAGVGITVNANDVALTTPVSVANGGTGATTAAAAVAALGGVAKIGDTMTGQLMIQPATGGANLSLAPVQAAQQAMINYYQGGAAKWSLGKNGDDSFFLYDSANATIPISTASGGTTINITRDVNLNASEPTLALNKSTATNGNYIDGKSLGQLRWSLIMGDAAAESGTSIGSNFSLYRYNNSGASLGEVLNIRRETAETVLYGSLNITEPTDPASGWIYFGNGATSWHRWMGFGSDTNCQIGNVGATSITQVDNLQSLGYVRSGTGQILSSTSGIILATNSAGTMYFRPAGAGSGTGQATLDSTSFVVAGQAYKPGGGDWVATSDIRIKNIEGEYKRGLAEITALRPVYFTYKGNDTPEAPAQGKSTPYDDSPNGDAAVSGKKFTGLIAQEVEKVLPEMVTKRDGYINGMAVDDLRDLDTTPLIFALINSVKELAGLQNTVKELKARVEALEAGG